MASEGLRVKEQECETLAEQKVKLTLPKDRKVMLSTPNDCYTYGQSKRYNAKFSP